jgi:hypothetical protein
MDVAKPVAAEHHALGPIEVDRRNKQHALQRREAVLEAA